VTSEDFLIAPKFNASDWKKLRTSQPIDWKKATQVLQCRLKDRFVDAADELEKLGDQPTGSKRFGFAILALDFILAETIQAFVDGVINHSGQSGKLISNFLKHSSEFEKCIGAADSETCAKAVYSSVRCAIHHSGSTDVGIKVKVSGDEFEFDGTSLLAINRKKFHQLVKRRLSTVMSNLQTENQVVLRRNFLKKFDSIANT
jgi:hypothetical protein